MKFIKFLVGIQYSPRNAFCYVCVTHNALPQLSMIKYITQVIPLTKYHAEEIIGKQYFTLWPGEYLSLTPTKKVISSKLYAHLWEQIIPSQIYISW